MENIAQTSMASDISAQNSSGGRTLYHAKNDRMGGSVPSWDAPKQAVVHNFDSVMSSYRPQPETIEMKPVSQEGREFGFLDLIDMVNPLQHIPLVNLAYRGLTGDEIKPMSKIIGGGLFGGPVGVAGGIVNAIIEEETGKDMLGNATLFAGINSSDKGLNARDGAEFVAYEDLPVSLLSFAQTPMPLREERADNNARHGNYERTQIAEGRTAGTIAVYT